ncbi:MAG: autotransporter outer membrane beta-barrel domain-containing protein [Thermoplasmataceae archaeon]
MYGKLAVASVIIALLLGATSVAAASSGGTTNLSTMGNYSFQYDNSSSVISNLTFQGETNSYLVANEVYVNGTSAMKLPTSLAFPAGSVNLTNGTIVNTGKENLFMIADTSLNGTVTYSLTSAPVKESVKVNMTIGSTGTNLNSMAIYQVTAGNRSAIIFSNGNATVNGNELTFTANASIKMLFTGVTNTASFEDYVRAGLESHSAFHYNQTTGAVIGSFVSFSIDTNTSVVSNFYSELTSNTVFTSISLNGNTNFSFNQGTPVFPSGKPIVVGSIFVLGTNSTIVAVHDNPAIVSRFIFDNGSATFNLGTGMNATVYNTTGEDHAVSEDVADNQSAASNIALGTDHSIEGGRQAVYIHGNGFRGFLLVGNANVTLTNGSTVVVTSTHIGMVGLVAPPGLQGSSQRAIDDLEWAIIHNKVGSEMTLNNVNGSIDHLSVSYNNSISLNLTNVQSGKIVMAVSSLQHVGNVVAVFVSNSVFANGSKITVSFDNTVISMTSFNGTINSTSATTAVYTVLHVQGGLLLLIHVPHFSNHTIAISYVQPGSTSLIPGGSGAVVVIGIVIVVVAVAAVMVTRKKNQP